MLNLIHRAACFIFFIALLSGLNTAEAQPDFNVRHLCTRLSINNIFDGVIYENLFYTIGIPSYGWNNVTVITMGIYNLDEPTAPVEMGFSEIPPLRHVRQIIVNGNYAYILHYDGILGCNLSDRWNITTEDILEMQECTSIALNGEYIYLVCADSIIYIFRLINGMRLEFVNEIETETSINKILVNGDRLFTSGMDLRIFSLDDPEAPELLSVEDVQCVDVAVRDDYVFLALDSEGVGVFSLNRDTLTFVRSLRVNQARRLGFWQDLLSVGHQFDRVMDRNGEIFESYHTKLFNVSNPEQIRDAGLIWTGVNMIYGDHSTAILLGQGGILFHRQRRNLYGFSAQLFGLGWDGWQGLYYRNVAVVRGYIFSPRLYYGDPENPYFYGFSSSLLHCYRISEENNIQQVGYTRNWERKDIIGGNNDYLFVWDYSQRDQKLLKAHPVVNGQLHDGISSLDEEQSARISGNFQLIGNSIFATNNIGFVEIDVSHPERLSVIGEYPLRNVNLQFYTVDLDHSVIYYSLYPNGVGGIDFNDRENPSLIDMIHRDAIYRPFYDMDRLYLRKLRTDTVLVYSADDPNNLSPLTYYNIARLVNIGYIKNNILMFTTDVVGEGGRMHFWDVTDLERPREVGLADYGGAIGNPIVKDGLLVFHNSRQVKFYDVSRALSVGEMPVLLPMNYLHLGAFPNPFNSSATVWLSLPSDGRAALALFDPLGRKVRDLIPGGWLSAGEHSVYINAGDLSAGCYILQGRHNGRTVSAKIALTK